MLVASRASLLRRKLCAWVTDLGLAAPCASSVEAAVREWKRLSPASIIVTNDLRGAAAVVGLSRRIRSEEGAARVKPCILLAACGYADPSEYEAYRAAGYDGVLTWPLRPEALRARLAACGLLSDGDARRQAAMRREAEALFTRELGEDIGRLKQAVLEASAVDIARWAHRIKGASLMFGQLELGEVAARIEGRDTARPPATHAELAVLLQHLDTLYQKGLGGSSSVGAPGAADLGGACGSTSSP